MLPEGGAADIEVDTSDSRAPAIDPGGHLIASFTFLEQSKDIAPYFTGHICWRCDCTEGVLCTVESQTAWCLRFSHVIISWSGWILGQHKNWFIKFDPL